MKIRTQIGHRKAADELGQMGCMSSDIADTARRSGNFRIKAPFHMRRIGCIVRRHPVLHEFDMNLVDPAQNTGGRNFARLTDHRIAGHGIADGEHQPLAPRQSLQLLCLGKIIRQRLVAHDINAGFKKRRGGCKMRMVRSGDHHRVDAILARGFGNGHRLKIGIGAVRGDIPRLATLLRLGRVGGKRAGDNVPAVGHTGGHGLCLRNPAAPDNTQPQAAGLAGKWSVEIETAGKNGHAECPRVAAATRHSAASRPP